MYHLNLPQSARDNNNIRADKDQIPFVMLNQFWIASKCNLFNLLKTKSWVKHFKYIRMIMEFFLN